MRSRITRTIATAATVGALALGVGATSVGTAGASTAAQTSGTAKVEVGDNFFKPQDLEVTAGTKVTWRNEGKVLHNVMPVKKGKWKGTSALTKGKSYSFRFKKPGTYKYYCTFHGSPTGGQHGSIVVTKAAPPTTTTTVAAG
jgi:plastocyanin